MWGKTWPLEILLASGVIMLALSFVSQDMDLLGLSTQTCESQI